MAKKQTRKIKELKTDFEEIEEGEPLEKKAKTSSNLGQSEEKLEDFEEKTDSSRFFEFLNPSTEPIETLANKKPRSAKSIEQDEDILSFAPKEDDKKREEKDYFTKSLREYDLSSPREEKKQDISTKPFQPNRVDFREVGREIRMQPREVFTPSNEMIRMSSSRKSVEERDYNIERVDFTEVGREKRYKLMK
ncbi:MAG: hypothetical protein ABIH28_02280 [archaeon]